MNNRDKQISLGVLDVENLSYLRKSGLGDNVEKAQQFYPTVLVQGFLNVVYVLSQAILCCDRWDLFCAFEIFSTMPGDNPGISWQYHVP